MNEFFSTTKVVKVFKYTHKIVINMWILCLVERWKEIALLVF